MKLYTACTMPMRINRMPKRGKNTGAPIEAAATVQIMPKITPATDPIAPMAEGPRPGLMLFMAYLLYSFLPQSDYSIRRRR